MTVTYDCCWLASPLSSSLQLLLLPLPLLLQAMCDTHSPIASTLRSEKRHASSVIHQGSRLELESDYATSAVSPYMETLLQFLHPICITQPVGPTPTNGDNYNKDSNIQQPQAMLPLTPTAATGAAATACTASQLLVIPGVPGGIGPPLICGV